MTTVADNPFITDIARGEQTAVDLAATQQR